MLDAVNANTNEEIAELKECCKKTRECDIVATLRLVAQDAKGNQQTAEISQAVVKNVRLRTRVDGSIVYSEIGEINGNINEIRKVEELWKAKRNHNDEMFKLGKAGDYDLTIDFIKRELEHSKVYCVSCHNPLFVSERQQEHGLEFATLIDCFLYGIENVSLSEIEYDLEQQAMAEQRQNGYDNYQYGGYDDGDGDEGYEEEGGYDLDNGEDIIDNDDRIAAVQDD